MNKESYIGFTSRHKEERWWHHQSRARKGSNTHFHRAIRKYGAENFLLEVLEEGWDPKIGKDIREPYWISVLKPEYNETAGGDGVIGHRHTEEFKRRQSERLIGNQITRGRKVHTKESKNRISLFFKGRKHTEVQNKAKASRLIGKKYAKHTQEQNKSKSIRMTGVKRGPYKKRTANG